MAGVTMEARKPSVCPECHEPIKPGSQISKMFTDDRRTFGHWCHSHCLARHVDAASGQQSQARNVEHIKAVIGSIKCPRCSAGVGDPCTDLGSEISWIHAKRRTAYKNAVRANEWRQAQAH